MLGMRTLRWRWWAGGSMGDFQPAHQWPQRRLAPGTCAELQTLTWTPRRRMWTRCCLVSCLGPTVIWASRLSGTSSRLGCDGTGSWRHRGWAEMDHPLPQGPPGQLTVLQGWESSQGSLTLGKLCRRGSHGMPFVTRKEAERGISKPSKRKNINTCQSLMLGERPV